MVAVVSVVARVLPQQSQWITVLNLLGYRELEFMGLWELAAGHHHHHPLNGLDRRVDHSAATLGVVGAAAKLVPEGLE